MSHRGKGHLDLGPRVRERHAPEHRSTRSGDDRVGEQDNGCPRPQAMGHRHVAVHVDIGKETAPRTAGQLPTRDEAGSHRVRATKGIGLQLRRDPRGSHARTVPEMKLGLPSSSTGTSHCAVSHRIGVEFGS